jgi:hypothetical protein
MQAVRPQFHQPNWNCRPEADGDGPPNRSQKSIEAAIEVAATRRVKLLR